MNIAILVGGRGKRLGYAEKSQIRICGKKLIDLLLEKFKNWNVVLVCRDEKQTDLFEGKCIIDKIENFGPLAGIYAALEYFNDYTAVIATDMPFVKEKIVRLLYKKALELRASALIPYGAGRFEPLLAVYSPSVMREIERSFNTNERKILNPIFRCDRVYLYDIECFRKFDKDLLSLFNINTLEDLKRAGDLCSSIGLEEL